MLIKAFPKVFSIGQDYIREIFFSEVEITEKIDGSQFCFGKVQGVVYMRSKGKQIFVECPDKMFHEAVQFVVSVQDRIPNDTVYYCEYLRQPRHNILKYSRTPHNHLALFGVSDPFDKFISDYPRLIDYAEDIGIEPVPLIYRGFVRAVDLLKEFLARTSILGNVEIEGIVVKNYSIPFLLGGQPIPLMAGKFVSEKYKETHRDKWGKENTGKGKWETFLESFRTEARWQKAIQHLRDDGKIENSPRDIGSLIREIQTDIESEEKDSIKEYLWKHFKDELMRKAIVGFPEWYKEQLLERAI